MKTKKIIRLYVNMLIRKNPIILSPYHRRCLIAYHRITVVVLLLITLSPYHLITVLYAEEINITSDKMEYDKLNSKAVFTGNVKLKAGDISLSCAQAEMDIEKKDICLENAFFTSCNLENPHYRHYAKKVHLILEKEITAKNVVFYIDDIPSGALPYYYKSLREKKLKIDFKHGYNQRNDYFSKGFIGYRFSEQFFSKIYIDYYSYKGWGHGIEEIYSFDNKIQGTIYGYHIWEHDTKIRRWNARIYHQQRFTDIWSAQINSNLASDESFNNFYTRDWIRIYRDVNSSVAFTRNTGMSTGRILFSRRDVFNTDDNKYLLTGMTVPSVSYITNQIKIKKLPLYYEFSANGAKTWLRSENFYRTNADGSIKFTNPLRLTRKITLTSAAGVKTNFQDRLNKEDTKDIYRWTYNTDLNFDIRSFYFLNHQFGYYFEQEPDKRHDDYRGVIADKLRTKHSAYIDNLTVRVWTGLDIRRKLNEKIINFREWLDGITSELEYNPYNFLNIYYRNDYNVLYEKPNSVRLNSELRLGPDRFDKSKEIAYLKNGFSYNRSTPNRLTLSYEVGLRPTTNWQVAYKMQSSFSYDFTEHRNNFKDYRYYERAVNIYRDLHCWEANFSYLDRVPLSFGEPNFYELWFNIRIKSELGWQKSAAAELERERKWYPWRK